MVEICFRDQALILSYTLAAGKYIAEGIYPFYLAKLISFKYRRRLISIYIAEHVSFKYRAAYII
jgi:hypothetical protein